MYINKSGKIIIKLSPQDWPHITFPEYVPLLDPHPLMNNEAWIDNPNKNLGNFKNGLAIITITRPSYQFSGLAAIDKKGDIILKFENVKSLFSFNNDFWAASSENSKFGFMNSKGKWIIYPSFDKIGIFSDGLARVKLNGNCGFIDSSGKIIINQDMLKGSSEIKTSSIFSYASDFCEGLAVVKTRGKYGFIDKSGNWIIKPNLEEALPFKDGVALVKFSSRAGWNYIDKQGKILFEKLQ